MRGLLAVQRIRSRNDADDLIGVYEVGIGVQYNSGIFFLRGGWEGHWWDDAGNTFIESGTPNDLSSSFVDIGVQAFTISAGITR